MQYAKVEDVSKAFQQISQNQQSLGELFNRNVQNIGNAFELTDGWLHVQRRVLNDHLKGEVQFCTDPSDGADFAWYFGQYNAVRAVAQAISVIKGTSKSAELVTSDIASAGDLEFGGDYAHQ